MYEKWLADDGKDLDLTRKQIDELRKKIDEVQASQLAHEEALSQKEDALNSKESILSVCNGKFVLEGLEKRGSGEREKG